MRVKLITLRYAPSLGGFDDRPLAEFIADKEILAVREHFFVVHDLPHLSCLVTYQDPGPSPSRRRKQDATDSLSAEERVLFGTLREWRAGRAREDGMPPYVILTNRQLAAVVRARPRNPNALLAIEGVGPARVKRYGKAILDLLHGAPHCPAEDMGERA